MRLPCLSTRSFVNQSLISPVVKLFRYHPVNGKGCPLSRLTMIYDRCLFGFTLDAVVVIILANVKMKPGWTAEAPTN